MPKIPIDECPAGPAMDMAVAEALGWHIEFWQDGADGGCELCDEEGNHVRPWSYDPSPRWRWSPSTDIAAAWELVIWCRANIEGQSLRLVGPEHPDESGCAFENGWDASFVNSQYVYTDIGQHTNADTAPLAICRAFLKANGIEHMEVPEGNGEDTD